MRSQFDVLAIGNALVDVIAPCDEEYLSAEGLAKGSMTLIDEARAHALHGRMRAPLETSGGTAANTVAGVASLGGRAGFIGKVADDRLARVFRDDLAAIGAGFAGEPARAGPSTGRCLIHVTPDAERTMCTYLGAAVGLAPDDVSAAAVEAADILYLEGYLFDPPEARRAFAKAAGVARAAGRTIALGLSDSFVVERHRDALLGFIETQVDVVFANVAEAQAMFPAIALEDAVAALAGRVGVAVVTDGAAGSRVFAQGKAWPVAARPVAAVVDTTGAGDQYAAGFLFGLARGRPLTACGALGALAASEVIAHVGPRPQVRLADLVEGVAL